MATADRISPPTCAAPIAQHGLRAPFSDGEWSLEICGWPLQFRRFRFPISDLPSLMPAMPLTSSTTEGAKLPKGLESSVAGRVELSLRIVWSPLKRADGGARLIVADTQAEHFRDITPGILGRSPGFAGRRTDPHGLEHAATHGRRRWRRRRSLFRPYTDAGDLALSREKYMAAFCARLPLLSSKPFRRLRLAGGSTSCAPTSGRFGRG